MNAILSTWARTLGRARNLYSTAFAIAVFLAASSAVFVWQLVATDGVQLSLAAVWAASVSPVLPILAAFLAMEVWSEERASGRIESLLSIPVSERDFALGKFLGVWSLLAMASVASAALTAVALRIVSPETLAGAEPMQFLAALLVLGLQAALWSSVSLALSALTVRPAIACASAVVVLAGLPRLGWLALRELSSTARTAYGEFPLDAQVVDATLGSFTLSSLVGYLLLTLAAVLFSAKAIEALRYVGRASRGRRALARAVGVLALAFSALATVIAAHHEVTVELPVAGLAETLTPNTRKLLGETSGTVLVSAYLSRADPRFRSVSHLLRSFRRESAALGGARIELEFVDPNWDFAATERMVRRGVAAPSLVFMRGRKTLTLGLTEGFDERLCASVFRQLMMTPARRNVYWTRGHGEFAFDNYTPFGLSDIARELVREGYRNSELDLTKTEAVPSDGALVAVAGAKHAFSRVELDRLESYLKDGGRLLVLTDPALEGGVNSLLPIWGLRVLRPTFAGESTRSGTDVIATDFATHPITAALAGSRIVFEQPLAFEPSVAAATGAGRVDFTPLATAGGSAIVAAVERGAEVGTDLAIRPTRLVAVGDATFLLNGQLAIRGNANREFFLNAVAWLAGVEPTGTGGADAGWLQLRPDRAGRMRFVTISVLISPLAFWLMLSLVTWIRRRRS